MDRIVNALYKLSSNMHTILNGMGKIDDKYWVQYGKLVDTDCAMDVDEHLMYLKSYDSDGQLIGGWSDVAQRGVSSDDDEDNEPGMLDCRNNNVDAEIKDLIKKNILTNIVEFYNSRKTEDEFLLMLGFSVNLYYIVGLYQEFGKFSLEEVNSIVEAQETLEYAKLINEYIYSRYISGVCERANNMKVENIQLYQDILETRLDKKYMVNISDIYKAVSLIDHKAVPDVYMLLSENDFERDAQKYLEVMIEKYPEFRFGHIYKCLEKGIDFYNSQGENIDVYEYKEKLGAELFWHILGLNSFQLDGVKFKIVNGKVETIQNELFSAYGIGIPCLQTIPRENYLQRLNTSVNSFEENVTGFSYKAIRESSEKDLGIHVNVLTDDDSAKYTVKLLEVVEKQKKELKYKNSELERLGAQQRKLMDHVAHSWGNECYPEIVKNVAEELLKKGQRTMANKLFKAYNCENNLMGDIIFLQAAISDDPRNLQNHFTDSFFISGKDKPEYKIKAILDDKLEVLVFSLLNYTGDNKKRTVCRNRLCLKHELNFLQDEYAKRLENNTLEEPFWDWFCEYMLPIKLEIDDTWESVNTGNTEYGKTVLKSIFNELFTNMLFHGCSDFEVLLTSDQERLYITTRNSVADNSKGSGKGLKSLREVITKLNYGTSISEEEGLQYGKKTNSIFETKITFAKELMIKEDW